MRLGPPSSSSERPLVHLQNDGQAAHLEGTKWPDLSLPSTSGKEVNIATLPGVAIVFVYSSSGFTPPERPAGPQEVEFASLAHSYKPAWGGGGAIEHLRALKASQTTIKRAGGSTIVGVALESPEIQACTASKLQLSFALASDKQSRVSTQLALPVLPVAGQLLLKEVVMIVCQGVIEKVFYPMPSPEHAPMRIVQWLQHCN